MASGDKRGGDRRAERLEAALRANLKKRKDQSKARARSSEAGDTAVAQAPSPKSDD